MIHAELTEVGFRWSRPTWERAADRTWILIVPSRYLSGPDALAAEDTDGSGLGDPYFDRTQRYYEVYDFDGSRLDQLHELQVERLLRQPGWRHELAQSQRIRFPE